MPLTRLAVSVRMISGELEAFVEVESCLRQFSTETKSHLCAEDANGTKLISVFTPCLCSHHGLSKCQFWSTARSTMTWCSIASILLSSWMQGNTVQEVRNLFVKSWSERSNQCGTTAPKNCRGQVHPTNCCQTLKQFKGDETVQLHVKLFQYQLVMLVFDSPLMQSSWLSSSPMFQQPS